MDNPQRRFKRVKSERYSDWHRYPTLPKWCYMTDADWFEQRLKDGQLRTVACIETIEVGVVDSADKDYPLFRSKKPLYQEMEGKMGFPVYIVWHNPECTDFLVLRITETKPKRMNESEYKEFIKGL